MFIFQRWKLLNNWSAMAGWHFNSYTPRSITLQKLLPSASSEVKSNTAWRLKCRYAVPESDGITYILTNELEWKKSCQGWRTKSHCLYNGWRCMPMVIKTTHLLQLYTQHTIETQGILKGKVCHLSAPHRISIFV